MRYIWPCCSATATPHACCGPHTISRRTASAPCSWRAAGPWRQSSCSLRMRTPRSRRSSWFTPSTPPCRMSSSCARLSRRRQAHAKPSWPPTLQRRPSPSAGCVDRTVLCVAVCRCAVTVLGCAGAVLGLTCALRAGRWMKAHGVSAFAKHNTCLACAAECLLPCGVHPFSLYMSVSKQTPLKLLCWQNLLVVSIKSRVCTSMLSQSLRRCKAWAEGFCGPRAV